MNRDQIISILAEAGIDTATCKAAVTNLLNAHNEELRNAKVEAANKALSDFSDWKSPEEYQALEEEFNTYKESAAKTERKSKYANNRVAEKWYDYVDDKLKGSTDFDKDLKAFLKDNPELLVKESTPSSRVSFSSLGDSGHEEQSNSNARMNAFIRGTLEK